MRRKTKIVLAITFMVAVLVLGFSYIYISELLRQRVTTAHESAAQLTSNLAYLAANAHPGPEQHQGGHHESAGHAPGSGVLPGHRSRSQ